MAEETTNINNRPSIIRDNTPGKPDTGRPDNIDLEQVSKDQETLRNQDGVNAGIERSRSRANRERKDARIIREQTISTPGTPNSNNEQARPPFINQGFDRKQDGFKVTTAAGNEFTGNNVTGGNLGVGQSVQGIAPNPNSPRGNGRGILLPPGPGRELPRPPEPQPSSTPSTGLDCLIIYAAPVKKNPVPEPIQTYFSANNWDQLCEEKIGCPGEYDHQQNPNASTGFNSNQRHNSLEACNRARRDGASAYWSQIGCPVIYATYQALYGYAKRSTEYQPGMPWNLNCREAIAYFAPSIFTGAPPYPACDGFFFPSPYTFHGGATRGTPNIFRYMIRILPEESPRLSRFSYDISGKYTMAEELANGWTYFTGDNLYVYSGEDGANNAAAEYGNIYFYCSAYNPLEDNIPGPPAIEGSYKWGLIFSHETNGNGCTFNYGIPTDDAPARDPDETEYFYAEKKYFVYSSDTKQILEIPLGLRTDEQSTAAITCLDSNTALVEIIISNLMSGPFDPNTINLSENRYIRNCGQLIIYTLKFISDKWTILPDIEKIDLPYTGQYIYNPATASPQDILNGVSESTATQQQINLLASINSDSHWNSTFTRMGNYFFRDNLPQPKKNLLEILQSRSIYYFLLKASGLKPLVPRFSQLQLLFNDGILNYKVWRTNQGSKISLFSPKLVDYRSDYLEDFEPVDIEVPEDKLIDTYIFSKYFQLPSESRLFNVEEVVFLKLLRNVFCTPSEKLFDDTIPNTKLIIMEWEVKFNSSSQYKFDLINPIEHEVEIGALLPDSIDLNYFRNIGNRWKDKRDIPFGGGGYADNVPKTLDILPAFGEFVPNVFNYITPVNPQTLDQCLTLFEAINLPKDLCKLPEYPSNYDFQPRNWYTPMAGITGLTFCKH